MHVLEEMNPGDHWAFRSGGEDIKVESDEASDE